MRAWILLACAGGLCLGELCFVAPEGRAQSLYMLQAGPDAPIMVGVNDDGRVGGQTGPPDAKGSTYLGVRFLEDQRNHEGTLREERSYSVDSSLPWAASYARTGTPRCPPYFGQEPIVLLRYTTTIAGVANVPAPTLKVQQVFEGVQRATGSSLGVFFNVSRTFSPSGSPYLYQEDVWFTGQRASALTDVRYRVGTGLTPDPRPPPGRFGPSLMEEGGRLVPAALRFSDNINEYDYAGGPLCDPTYKDPTTTSTQPAPSCYPGVTGAPDPADPNGGYQMQQLIRNGPGSQVPLGGSPVPGAFYGLATAVPCYQSATVELGLRNLAQGQTRHFTELFGAAPNPDAALAAVQAVGADIWFLAQSWYAVNDPAFAATPTTYIYALRGIGGPDPAFQSAFSGGPWRPDDLASDQACAGAAFAFSDTSMPGLTGSPLVGSDWEFGDGNPSSGHAPGGTVTHAYEDVGEYTVVLTEEDQSGFIARTSQVMHVVDCHRAPLVTAVVSGGPDCLDGDAHFDVSATDPDGGGVAFAWNPGDGTRPLYGAHVIHRYQTKGAYNVVVTATDDEGQTSTAASQFPSPGPPNCPPTLAQPPVLRVARGSSAGWLLEATDADGPTLDIEMVDAPGRPVLDSTPGLETATASFRTDSDGLQVGTYRANFLARDGRGATDQKTGIIILYDFVGDTDLDGIQDAADNCPAAPNQDQADQDGDGLGDACARLAAPVPSFALSGRQAGVVLDRDWDGIADGADDCPTAPNRDQHDLDLDGAGDVCDPDADGDGVIDRASLGVGDNCLGIPNADQADVDGNGLGDACQDLAQPAAARPRAGLDGMALPAPTPNSALWLAPVLVVVALPAVLARRIRAAAVMVFSRLTRNTLLEHPVRAQIHDAVTRQPGIHLGQLTASTGLAASTVRHHARVLQDAGLLAARRVGGYLCFHISGMVVEPSAEWAKSDVAKAILAELARRPGASLPDLARQLGTSRGTIRHHVARLVAGGALKLEHGHVRVVPPPVRPPA